MKQATNNIFLVRPANFGFNAETAKSNAFQNTIALSQSEVTNKVLGEFDKVVEELKNHDINVQVFEDTKDPIKPDAIFPNNWASYHESGTIILYPVAAKNRRYEKRPDIIQSISEKFKVNEVIDLSHFEEKDQFLESTGSIIFDHINKIAYACLSERTDELVLNEVCKLLNYQAFPFSANDKNNKAIYHTNVMMCITENLAIICLESINDKIERQRIVESLQGTNHQIIDISLDQVKSLAGNMIGLKNSDNEDILIMSETAHKSLSSDQINAMESITKILPLKVDTIETIGGGGIRCMIAEIFLPLLK